MTLIAHSSPDGRKQPFSDHATTVSRLASDFAAEFGAADEASVIGLLHDIGKCSAAGQRRLNGSPDRVEHAAAGAEVLGDSWQKNPFGYLLAYCVAGHHAGLPDGGVSTDTEDRPTLCAKLKRQKKRNFDYAPYAEALA